MLAMFSLSSNYRQLAYGYWLNYVCMFHILYRTDFHAKSCNQKQLFYMEQNPGNMPLLPTDWDLLILS